jgi:hypothetical protein
MHNPFPSAILYGADYNPKVQVCLSVYSQTLVRCYCPGATNWKRVSIGVKYWA